MPDPIDPQTNLPLSLTEVLVAEYEYQRKQSHNALPPLDGDQDSLDVVKQARIHLDARVKERAPKLTPDELKDTEKPNWRS